jgi:hypothetical protein
MARSRGLGDVYKRQEVGHGLDSFEWRDVWCS